MKKEWILILGSTCLTLFLALGLIKWLAPQLLGLSPDLQLVQVDKKTPPFFDNLFRSEDYAVHAFHVQDPITGVRGKPRHVEEEGLGPHDILGFRNRSIPESPKVIVFGDSQTYGLNADIEHSWPGYLATDLAVKKADLYNMALGGWTMTQYFNMFVKSFAFQPEVVIFAIYTGNDALESFVQVYGNEYWKSFIPDKSLSADDAPDVVFPPPEDAHWQVEFKDGLITRFTPDLRLASNSDHPAVVAGYQIIKSMISLVADLAKSGNTKVYFTLIPTKELVYAKRINTDGIQAPLAYQTLIERELKNHQVLIDHIQSYPQLHFINLLPSLEQAAMGRIHLYPHDGNGHPFASGYKVIAQAISEVVVPEVSAEVRQLIAVEGQDKSRQVFLLKNRTLYYFESEEIMNQNGWNYSSMINMQTEQVAGFSKLAIIDSINPELYGPLKP